MEPVEKFLIALHLLVSQERPWAEAFKDLQDQMGEMDKSNLAEFFSWWGFESEDL